MINEDTSSIACSAKCNVIVVNAKDTLLCIYKGILHTTKNDPIGGPPIGIMVPIGSHFALKEFSIGKFFLKGSIICHIGTFCPSDATTIVEVT